MKVLWFANTPCSAAEKLGSNITSGGWLKSLEQELKNISEVELAVCFYYYKRVSPFVFENVQYFPIFKDRKRNIIRRILKNNINYKNFYSNNDMELKEIINAIKTFNPDVIHIHGTEENFGLVQKYTAIPIVISIQGILSSIMMKMYSGIPYEIKNKYGEMQQYIKEKVSRYLYSNINQVIEREQKILEHALYIIGRTDWDRRITRVLANKSQYFQANEILRESFYHDKWNKKMFGFPIQIVTIINDALYKGLETIVDVALLLNKQTNINFFWKVIGINNNSKTTKIVKKWKKVNFNEININIIGELSENEIKEILINSDLYCQTSHIENSSNSLCEAMLLGMPIVATNAGGSSSILKDKEEGILVQDGDPYAMVGAIYELINDIEKAIFYGKNARITALKRHNKKDIVNAIYTIYKSISIK